MNEKLTINQWAVEDRPREKMMMHGVASLSNAELLAILIGTGNSDESAVDLMRKILNAYHNNLHDLGKASIEELCEFKGIGPAKAVAIKAASELGKRRKEGDVRMRKAILHSKDIYEFFYPLLCDLSTEEAWVLLLNQAFHVIDRVRVSAGGISATVVDVRCILREALLKHASAIVLCHNHPSGKCSPSKEDDRLTQQVHLAAQIMNIRLVDHIIVTDGSFYSYADDGKI